MSEEFILVGRFGAPHGVRGEIRIKSFTEEPMALARYGALCDRSGARAFHLSQARHQKDDMLVARVEGVATRDAAAALTNTDIYVPRSQLPEAEEDEFYLSDLIGLEARLATGERYGRIVNVANFGAGDILEIDRGEGETVLLPFTKAAVPDVKLAQGHVIVDPPGEIEGEPRPG